MKHNEAIFSKGNQFFLSDGSEEYSAEFSLKSANSIQTIVKPRRLKVMSKMMGAAHTTADLPLIGDKSSQMSSNLISETHSEVQEHEEIQLPQVCTKTIIPGLYQPSQPLLVNSKQARRMMIMRQKKSQKALKQIEFEMQQAVQRCNQTALNPVQLIPGKFTNPRKKDLVRSALAHQRRRIKGLFVNKKIELQLMQKPKKHRDRSDSDSETDDPD